MAEIINLNRVRKMKVRIATKAQADANSVAFGRTKAQKQADRAEAAHAARDLDGNRRER